MSVNVAEVSANNLSGLVSKKEFKPIISDKVKTGINLGFNGAAAAINLLTIINGNFSIIEALQEKMEWFSAHLSKLATVAQGLVNASIAIEKKNIVALVGGLLELPIAFFISGFNLFLARGVSAGLNHFDSIISRTKKTIDGKIITDDKDNPQYYDSFEKEGWLEGFKTICRHIPILSKEFYQKPFERQGLFPRSFFLCSLFMILGPIISSLGLYKSGATIRHVFGGLAGIALATDMKTNTNIKQRDEGLNNKAKGLSYYAMSGVIWVLAAIPDVLKHFEFFSNKVNNGTDLALMLDRLAGLCFIFGNQRKGEK